MNRIIVILSFLIFSSGFLYSQNCDLSTDCGTVIADWGLANNETFVCEGLPFEVQVNPNTTSDIDSIIWYWGDGQFTATTSTANQTHTYVITDSIACLTPIQELYDITMEVYKFCDNGVSCHRQSAPVAVKFKPRAFMNIPPEICVGVEEEFINTSCNGEEFLWEFGDGSSSIDENTTHQYLNTGNYTVTLTVTNTCGTDQTVQQITVVDPAQAKALVMSSSLDTTESPIIVCLGELPILLNGDSLSLNENFYEWNSLSGQDATWVLPMGNNDLTPNIPNPSILFQDTGLFEIILEVDNLCEQPDFDTLYFQVLSGAALSSPNEPDGCITLDFTPSNFNNDATYTLNGNIIPNTSFPFTLNTGTHIIQCELSNECGNQITLDTFVIFPEENITIFSPSTDTTLCLGSDSIQILYEPFGGTWTGEHLIINGDSVFFYPNEIGSFEITYQIGVQGTECSDIKSITINVEDSGIQVVDHEVCSTSLPFPMGAIPTGGVYTSIDCPLCIQGDSFIISEMVALGLTSVIVSYAGSSISGCDGNNTFTVDIDDPSAMFMVADTFCLDDPVLVDISNTNGTLTWMLDGQNISSPPFSNLSAGSHTIKLTAEAGDCEDELTETIYITAPPMDVSFTAQPVEGCADLEIILTNTTSSFDNESYEWYINDSLFSTSIQPNPIILGPGFSDTIYTISLSAGNSCTSQVSSQDITVFPRPVPRFGTEQNNYCSGDTVRFSNVSFGGPMSSWLWDYGNGVTSTDSIPLEMIYFTDSIPTTYTVTLTATNNCGTETYSFDLMVNPTDVTAFFNTDPTEGCVGLPVCVTNFSTLGANVLWDFGDGNTSTQSEICHTYSQAGTYTITLKAFGCGFDSTEFTIVIHPMPIASFNNNTISCPGDTLDFVNTSILAESFLWNFGDGDTSTLNNPNHVFDASGSYIVTLYVTSINGCVDSMFSNVQVLTPPSASFTTSTDSICVNQNITFTSTSNPNPLSCFWDFGDGNFSNECNPSHNYSTSGDFIVLLIITNANGCRDTAQQLVNIAPIPSPAFDYTTDQGCTPVVVTFINQTTLGQSYLWNFGNGDMSTVTSPFYTYVEGGNFTVELTATNGICTQTTSQIIDINKTPEVEIIAPLGQEGCAEFNAPLSASPVGSNFNYTWDLGDGSFSFEPDLLHTFILPNTYQVTLEVEDQNSGCSDMSSLQIEIFEPVEATIAKVDNLCFGDALGSIDLTITNGTPNYQYEWSNGIITPDNENLPAGNYTITITDNNQCTLSQSIEITQPSTPLSIEILEEKIVSCYGGSDGAITIEAIGGTSGYNYLWQTGGTITSISNVPAGQYTLTITDANNCVIEEILTIQQNDSIAYDATVTNISCYGYGDGQVNLENFTGGVPPYFATLPQLDSVQGTGFNNLTPDNYTIILADGEGCLQNFNATIIEPPQVWLELDEDSVSIPLGVKFEIKGDYNVANPIFSWGPDRWLDCYDCDEPVAFPFANITYDVLMVDQNGCFDSDTIFIEVIDERGIAVPNIFTPNNDGQNDVFTLLGRNPAVLEVASFKIYDRHGGILHQKENFPLNDPAYGWNGKHNGSDVQIGSYVYTVLLKYVDGGELEWQDSFMLVR